MVKVVYYADSPEDTIKVVLEQIQWLKTRYQPPRTGTHQRRAAIKAEVHGALDHLSEWLQRAEIRPKAGEEATAEADPGG